MKNKKEVPNVIFRGEHDEGIAYNQCDIVTITTKKCLKGDKKYTMAYKDMYIAKKNIPKGKEFNLENWDHINDHGVLNKVINPEDWISVDKDDAL